MHTINLTQLNTDFGFHNDKHRLSIEAGKGDIPVVVIENAQASAIISLQGAHLLSWIPTDDDEVIWLSKAAKFAMGKSVRGGIPICWPWFGPHGSHNDYPAHGFARTVMWQVTKSRALSADETQITFQLDSRQLAAELQPMWPQATVVEYCLTIGKTLSMDLTTYNHSDETITIGEALHTYFQIKDVSETSVSGLEGSDYLDKVDDFKRKTQNGPITINSEVDRIYLNTTNVNVIDDRQRRIIIKKEGSHSTVVWNPWQATAAKMGDLGNDGYRKMLCVESANAAENTVQVSAGGQHTMRVTYRLEK